MRYVGDEKLSVKKPYEQRRGETLLRMKLDNWQQDGQLWLGGREDAVEHEQKFVSGFYGKAAAKFVALSRDPMVGALEAMVDKAVQAQVQGLDAEEFFLTQKTLLELKRRVGDGAVSSSWDADFLDAGFFRNFRAGIFHRIGAKSGADIAELERVFFGGGGGSHDRTLKSIDPSGRASWRHVLAEFLTKRSLQQSRRRSSQIWEWESPRSQQDIDFGDGFRLSTFSPVSPAGQQEQRGGLTNLLVRRRPHNLRPDPPFWLRHFFLCCNKETTLPVE